MANVKHESNRRPYHEPQVEQVLLIAEEAVLQNCKFGFGSGQHGPLGHCAPGLRGRGSGGPGPCYVLGT